MVDWQIMDEKVCNKCGISLTEDNWFPSSQINYKNICKNCETKQGRVRYLKKREGMAPKKMGGTRIWSKAEPKICVGCHKEFTPHKYNQVSCSKECWVKWYIETHQQERCENSKRWERQNRARSRLTSKLYRERFRLEALEKLSNGKIECIRCGFSDIRALAIDHINGGGAEERKKIGTAKIIRDIVLQLSKEESQRKYQILCYNCNRIKQVENEEHHKPILLEDEVPCLL